MDLDFHVSYKKTTQVAEPPPAPLARRLENKFEKKMTSRKNHATAAHTAAHTQKTRPAKLIKPRRA